MRSTAASPEEYIAELPQDRKEVFSAIAERYIKEFTRGIFRGY